MLDYTTKKLKKTCNQITIETETVLHGGEHDNRYDTVLKSRLKDRIKMDKNGETRRPEIEEHDASKKLFQSAA